MNFVERGFGIRAAVGCSDRGHTAVSQLAAGDVDWAAIFEREGTTLFAHAPISFTTAALGGSIVIPGLDGEQHDVKVAPGTQSGREVRQRGAGMPVLQGKGRGDLVVRISVETPTRLTAKQRELLEEFRCTETGDECPQTQGFFQKVKKAVGG